MLVQILPLRLDRNFQNSHMLKGLSPILTVAVLYVKSFPFSRPPPSVLHPRVVFNALVPLFLMSYCTTVDEFSSEGLSQPIFSLHCKSIFFCTFLCPLSYSRTTKTHLPRSTLTRGPFFFTAPDSNFVPTSEYDESLVLLLLCEPTTVMIPLAFRDRSLSICFPSLISLFL